MSAHLRETVGSTRQCEILFLSEGCKIFYSKQLHDFDIPLSPQNLERPRLTGKILSKKNLRDGTDPHPCLAAYLG